MADPKPSGFYVYEFRGPDGVTFYVGKGTHANIPSRERFYRHRREHVFEARSRHLKLYRKIRSIWAKGGDYTEHVVFSCGSESEAFQEERRLISLYGRRNLCNLTDGGDGSTGYRHTSAARQRMSKDRKGKPCPESTKKAISVALTGKPCRATRYSGDEHWTHCKPHLVPRGEKCYQALVTREIVETIRREYVPRKVPVRVFVERYGLKRAPFTRSSKSLVGNDMSRIERRGGTYFIPHEIDREAMEDLFNMSGRELAVVNFKGWRGILRNLRLTESAEQPIAHWTIFILIDGELDPREFTGTFPITYDPPWNDRFDREDVV
jgi:hypothetical protein